MGGSFLPAEQLPAPFREALLIKLRQKYINIPDRRAPFFVILLAILLFQQGSRRAQSAWRIALFQL